MTAEAWAFWKELLVLIGIVVLFVGQRLDKRRTRKNAERNDREHQRNYDEIKTMGEQVLTAHKYLVAQSTIIKNKLASTDANIRTLAEQVKTIQSQAEVMRSNQDTLLSMIAEVDGKLPSKRKPSVVKEVV